MKTLKITLLFLVLTTICSFGQFRVEVGGMFGGRSDSKSIGLYLSPSYKFGRFAAGLRGEALSYLSTSLGSPSYIYQTSINGQYYITSGSVNTFIGVGGGIYGAATSTMMCDCSVEMKGSSLGFYPRIGMSYGHLVIAVEYNIVQPIKTIAKSELPGYNYSSETRVNIDYLDVKLGVQIGGGKRPK